MIARARAHCDFPWTAWVVVIAVGATASAFASASIADALVADARIAHGQLWRALTGPFVHATWGHLVRDLALVAIAGAGYEAALRSRRCLVFAGGLVVPAIAVLAAGDARWYELVARRGMARAVVLALGLVSGLKPIYELATGSPAFAMSLGPGVAQVPLAHVVGVLVGIAAGLLAGLDRARGGSAEPASALTPPASCT